MTQEVSVLAPPKPKPIPKPSRRPGYVFDNHKKLVEALNSILDAAAVEYDHSEDVVDDFTAYLKEWARQRDAPKW